MTFSRIAINYNIPVSRKTFENEKRIIREKAYVTHKALQILQNIQEEWSKERQNNENIAHFPSDTTIPHCSFAHSLIDYYVREYFFSHKQQQCRNCDDPTISGILCPYFHVRDLRLETVLQDAECQTGKKKWDKVWSQIPKLSEAETHELEKTRGLCKSYYQPVYDEGNCPCAFLKSMQGVCQQTTQFDAPALGPEALLELDNSCIYTGIYQTISLPPPIPADRKKIQISQSWFPLVSH